MNPSLFKRGRHQRRKSSQSSRLQRWYVTPRRRGRRRRSRGTKGSGVHDDPATASRQSKAMMQPFRLVSLGLAVISFTTFGTATAQQRPEQPPVSLLFVNVRVFDGKAEKLSETTN